MNTPAAIAQTAPTTSGQISAYSVDGLALGARGQSSNSGYREYKCSPSDQFDGFMWCQKARQQKERRGNYSVTYSLLHSRDGKIVYVNRFQAPAFFGPNEAEGDIQRYSRKLGESARITRMPHRSGVPDGILAAWGNVKLEPLDSASIAVLGKGGSPKKGYIVDFIGDFARSAKEGLADLPCQRRRRVPLGCQLRSERSWHFAVRGGGCLGIQPRTSAYNSGSRTGGSQHSRRGGFAAAGCGGFETAG